jgi:hypothetical protein
MPEAFQPQPKEETPVRFYQIDFSAELGSNCERIDLSMLDSANINPEGQAVGLSRLLRYHSAGTIKVLKC